MSVAHFCPCAAEAAANNKTNARPPLCSQSSRIMENPRISENDTADPPG